MTTDVALFKGSLPAYLKNAEFDDITKSLMGSGNFSSKRISLKGNMFRMISNGEEMAVSEDRAMNIVIVNAAPTNSRQYYKGKFKEGVKSTPVCWSSDGKVPAATAPERQAPQCADCPQNIKGSGEGESKACRYSRKLAVVLDGDMGGDVFELTLAAGSIFGTTESGKLSLEAYVRYLATHKVPVTAVVTEMRFDTKSPVPKLTFKAVRPLSEDEWEICTKQGKSPDAVRAVEVNFTVKDKAEKEAEPEFEQAKPAAKAKPKVEDEDEPVKVKSKSKSEPPEEKKELTEIMEDWASDD